jgi:HIRAN domain-containing protein
MSEIETPIVGTKFQGQRALDAVAGLRIGLQIELRRENHPKDANAIQCWALGIRLGYLSRLVNEPIARAMDSGGAVDAIVTRLADFGRTGNIVKEPMIRVQW